MSLEWSLVPQATPSDELLTAIGGATLLAQLLVQRGFHTPAHAAAFLDPDCFQPAAPTELIGLSTAAQIIHRALEAQQPILVWGDFDVDGQTSTSLLVAALRELAEPSLIRFHVPNRLSEGHGIQVEILETLLSTPEDAAALLLTCDTGITEGAAIGYAKDNGIGVVVTDHHALPDELSHALEVGLPLSGLSAAEAGAASIRRADAIVNPQLQPDGHPLRSLPGVGVAYLLMQAVFALAGRSGDEQPYLDLVALGIVADVAEQTQDTRYLLQRGLSVLGATRRTGLLALMDVARVDPDMVSAEDIGFQLGPRMNALGRLGDATIAVELLTTTDAIRAGQLAARTERLNQQRRLLTSQITSTALELLERNPDLLEFNAIVLAHPAWHAGIVGIVAARLVEQFHKPTVLLLTPPDGPARGSARSVDGVDIGAAIAGCAHLLIAHGGHPGAAGLRLLRENIDRFRRELDRQIELHSSDEHEARLKLDLELPLGKTNLVVAQELHRMAPFGSGNPMPNLLARQLTVTRDRRFGRTGDHRRLEVTDAAGNARTVLWFNASDTDALAGSFDLAYQLNLNSYRGKIEPQLLYVDSRPAQPTAESPAPAQRQAIRVIDLRNQTIEREQLPSPEISTWFVEGIQIARDGPVAYSPRTGVSQARTGIPLVVWSIPPSAELLLWLCETSEPDSVFLCGQSTTQDSITDILRAVAAMCKYALNRQGQLDLVRMAARLGITKSVIRHSLSWLQHKGEIAINHWGTDEIAQVSPGTGKTDPVAIEWSEARLKEQLAEIRAYRRYFLRARVSDLGLGPVRVVDMPS